MGSKRQGENHLGEKRISNEGYEMEIIEQFSCKNCTIRFTQNEVILYNRQYSNFKRGMISNPYHRGMCGVGYIGEGIYSKRENNKMSKCYSVWQSMLTRCCSEDYKNKKPTYRNVTVCGDWECFQNFAQWFYKKYKPESMQDWELDKDILIKSNKIYSPETCCFVPPEINSLLRSTKSKRGKYPIGVTKCGNKFRARIGKDRDHLGLYHTKEEAFNVFKIAKEIHIKDVAEIWKPLIEDRIYKALYQYSIEITD